MNNYQVTIGKNNRIKSNFAFLKIVNYSLKTECKLKYCKL